MNSELLKGQTVLVTGGGGFLGQYVCKVLTNKGANAEWFNQSSWDLTTEKETQDIFKTLFPEFVIHCAGFNGGIEYNRNHPAEILDKNAKMALNVHKAAEKYNAKKIVSVITSCAYPDTSAEVLCEETLWDGLPNPTVRGHGIAKRMLQACATEYHQQHGLNAVTTAITNLYGPGDTFNIARTKVVGAVIRKLVEARDENKPYVEFWGTGKPLREFMYVEDAAEALVQALELYEDHSKPINIGSNEETSILSLVEQVNKVVGYNGEIRWLTEKGDGQMRKLLDTTTMRNILDVDVTPLSVGLEKTINWYIDNKGYADERK